MNDFSKLPRPNAQFTAQVNAAAFNPLQASYSGELVATQTVPLGAAKKPGRLSDFWLSANASGKDDNSALQVSGEVYINSVSALTTRPSIEHVSGEASQNKTTKVTGDTGITQAVIDQDANTVAPGDMITAVLTVVRTATPATEMSNLAIVVELQPLKTEQ